MRGAFVGRVLHNAQSLFFPRSQLAGSSVGSCISIVRGECQFIPKLPVDGSTVDAGHWR